MSSKIRAGILYQGPSRIDGAPVVAIAVYPRDAKRTNAKTGNVLQSFILRADVDPVSAVRLGLDSSICGNCRHRGRVAPTGEYVADQFTCRSCYVNIGRSVAAVFGAFTRGAYPVLSRAERRAIGRGRMVRLGTYGDPAAIPIGTWRDVLAESIGHTGYSHQWQDARFQALREYCMASVDSADELALARAAGWRTFRVRSADEPMLSREFACPASAESGKVIQCAQCRACDGASSRKGSPVIIAHGAFARRFELNRAQAQQGTTWENQN